MFRSHESHILSMYTSGLRDVGSASVSKLWDHRIKYRFFFLISVEPNNVKLATVFFGHFNAAFDLLVDCRAK
jgi:hypothetical protein